MEVFFFVWVWVVGLFVSFVLIYLSQSLIITRVAWCLDCSLLIFQSFIVLWDIAHAVIMQLLACEEPPCDGGVEARYVS